MIILFFEDEDWSYAPTFYDQQTADLLLENLLKELPFKQHYVKVWNKTLPEPRLSSFHSQLSDGYEYANSKREVNRFARTLELIRKDVSKFLDIEFNGVLCNWYENGEKNIGWHSDSESGMDIHHIASISLGATRKFRLRSKETKEQFEYALPHGSLIYMHSDCQKKYKHCVPKEKKIIEGRLNLTFRVMKQ